MRKFSLNSTLKRLVPAIILLVLGAANAQAAKDLGKVRIRPEISGVHYEELVPHSYQDHVNNIQNIVNRIPNKENANYCSSFNWGDDEIMNTEAIYIATSHFDEGEYDYWYQDNSNFLHGYRSTLEHAWFCINLANIGLANLDAATGCTAEEKATLEGQLYFFRAWWHQELMTYYGPMPYIDYELNYMEIIKVPRLTAKEAAEKCAADFAKAASLLPSSAEAGLPSNVAAKAYEGKVLLWAASPLNNLGAQTGALANGNTYLYNKDLAQKAASALGSVITSVNGGATPYELAEFRFSKAQTADPKVYHSEDFTQYEQFPFEPIDGYTPQMSSTDGLVCQANGQSLQVYLTSSFRLTVAGTVTLAYEVCASESGEVDINMHNSKYDKTVTASLPTSWETRYVVFDDLNIVRVSTKITLITGNYNGTIRIRNIKLLEGDPTSKNLNMDGVYNHVRPDDTTNFYSDIFYTTKQNWAMPGAKEAIFTGPVPEVNTAPWNFAKTWGPKMEGIVAHDNIIHQPTANYINYAYGMANGLPLTDPDSGFDPAQPFKNRDPRFYHDIVYDGCKYINETDPLNSSQKNYEYCQLYTNGNMRSDYNGSRTGYFCQKLVPHQCNAGDLWYDWGYSLQCYLPYMRLADIYLMYAEACAAYGSATTSNGATLSAVDAINVLRDRVGAGHVADKYLADNNLFMDEVRRERACELAFEGQRWSDLSRWLLLTEEPYNKKTSQEFTRKTTNQDSPYENKVNGWSESLILTRDLTDDHYVFPMDPNNPPEIDIIYSEDGKTILYYPAMKTDEEFVIPETVTAIGDNCFLGCGYLKRIIMHDGITQIGAGAFRASGITQIAIPSSITTLSDYCFADTYIEKMDIPARITSIGARCFNRCVKLTEVVLHDGLQSIGEGCFDGATLLRQITIPSTVTSLGSDFVSNNNPQYWFSDKYSSLEHIEVAAGNTHYASKDGLLYTKDMSELILCPAHYKGELVLPETVRKLHTSALDRCCELTKVTLPASVEEIGYYCFSSCPRLQEVVCKAVEVPAFSGGPMVSNYSNLYVPTQSLDKYKGEMAYNYVFRIMSIEGGKTEYGVNDFAYEVSYTYSPFSGSLFADPNAEYISVGNNDYCGSYTEILDHITDVWYDGVKQNLSECIITQDVNGKNVKALVVPNPGARNIVCRTDGKITELPSGYQYLPGYNKIPGSVKAINSYDFWYNSVTLELSDGLETLKTGAFYQYNNITINLPKTVKEIEDAAFQGSMLGYITVDPENMHFSVLDDVLYTKDMTELVYFPACKYNAKYVIPEGVNALRHSAFWFTSYYGNHQYTMDLLDLPSTIQTIGDECFYNRSITTLICRAETMPEIADDAFTYSYIHTLYVPDNLVDTYKATSQCDRIYEILPLSVYTSDIKEVESNVVEHKHKTAIYSLDGRQQSKLRKGINIVVGEDGTARKVMIK